MKRMPSKCYRLHAAFIDWLEKYRLKRARAALLRVAEPTSEIARVDWPVSLSDPTRFYARCYRYFHKKLPPEVRTHRHYFEHGKRGFGEDAFHAMWFLLVREFRPANFLEIGVYRGQTLSLVAVLQRLLGIPEDVTGISPFAATTFPGGRYRADTDYMEDTLLHFGHFGLSKPALKRGYSTEESARQLITSRKWAAVYIDGNHDYPVVKADWELCSESIGAGGIIVLDDAGLTTPFQPPPFSTKGIDGPSQLAAEIDRTRFDEILQVGHNRVFQKRLT